MIKFKNIFACSLVAGCLSTSQIHAGPHCPAPFQQKDEIHIPRTVVFDDLEHILDSFRKKAREQEDNFETLKQEALAAIQQTSTQLEDARAKLENKMDELIALIQEFGSIEYHQTTIELFSLNTLLTNVKNAQKRCKEIFDKITLYHNVSEISLEYVLGDNPYSAIKICSSFLNTER
jgi:hypothetical protein